MTQTINKILIGALLCLVVTDLSADDADASPAGWTVENWMVMTSVYTLHFDEEPHHVNNQKLIGVEAEFSNRWILGASVFDNSFGQDSQFVYIARKWQLKNSEYWFVKLRGGLLHGYKEPYENKIPLNGLGIAPAIIPSLGFQYKNFVTELNIAGTAAAMLAVGWEF